MKNILFTLLIFSAISYSQNKEIYNNYIIEYDIILNTERPLTKSGTLILNNSYTKSFFYETKKGETKTKKSESGIDFIIISKKIKFNFIDYSKDSLVSKENLFFDEYNVKERIPYINWQLTNETKYIDSLEVKCAKTNFRGRNYIAWYSSKYPIKSGPWKFNGLPGLIINVYDESRRYEWNLKKIYRKKIKFEKLTNEKVNNDLPTIELKDFINLGNKNNIKTKLSSRLPRQLNLSNSKTKRNSKELIFEWEEETKKE
tara:strand:+ start:634 stop:1407 length:774 start_codon:yes stop_codon:yes gene_type:complete